MWRVAPYGKAPKEKKAQEEAKKKQDYNRCVSLCRQVRVTGDRTTYRCSLAYDPYNCIYYQPGETSCTDWGVSGNIMYAPNTTMEMAGYIVSGCKGLLK